MCQGFLNAQNLLDREICKRNPADIFFRFGLKITLRKNHKNRPNRFFRNIPGLRPCFNVILTTLPLKSQSIDSKKFFFVFSKYIMSEDNNYARYETATQDRSFLIVSFGLRAEQTVFQKILLLLLFQIITVLVNRAKIFHLRKAF